MTTRLGAHINWVVVICVVRVVDIYCCPAFRTLHSIRALNLYLHLLGLELVETVWGRIMGTGTGTTLRSVTATGASSARIAAFAYAQKMTTLPLRIKSEPN